MIPAPNDFFSAAPLRTGLPDRGVATSPSPRLIVLLIIAAFLLVMIPAHAAELRYSNVLQSADFVLGKSATPPADSEAWQPVTLPDDWRRIGADFRGRGWYRISFDISAAPIRPLAVYLRHLRSSRVDFFVNGMLIGGSVDLHAPSASGIGSPSLLTIPPHVLRAGPNVLHVMMDARSATNPASGLGHLVVGDVRSLREINQVENDLTGNAYRLFFAAMLTAGVITLFLWFARRGDRIMLAFSIICLTWAIAQGVYLYARNIGIPLDVMRMLQQYTNHGLPAAVVILCLRSVGKRWPGVEALLWAHLAFVVTFPLWWSSPHAPAAWTYLRIANPLLPLAGAMVVLLAAPRPLRWSHGVEALALLTMTLMLSFDIARDAGLIALDSHVFRGYHIPAFLLAIGTTIFEHHVAAVWRTQRMNDELEKRVAEKTREIESNHQRVVEAERERTLALERQRILADMHDGLGASLITLLKHVQSGDADQKSIEHRVQIALQEMRVAVDALQPNEDDLAAVLGNLRYRVDNMIRATGVNFEWQVDSLPPVGDLSPSRVFSLQRILLEAITNALKHSGTRTLSVIANARDGASVEIRIVDDGRGFDPAQAGNGLGLNNMKSRAQRIGAGFEVYSTVGSGTEVRISLPCDQLYSVSQLATKAMPHDSSCPLSPAPQPA